MFRMVKPVFNRAEFSERSDIFLYLVSFQAEVSNDHDTKKNIIIPRGKFRLHDNNEAIRTYSSLDAGQPHY